MFVYHFRLRKRVLAAGAAVVGLVLALAIFLPGCRSSQSEEPIMLETVEQQLEFLTSLGWTVNPTPIETLDLQLPRQWDGEWSAYVELQNSQGLPFSDFAGKQVRRCTYTLTNYPGIAKGVQANLYIYEGALIGGDILSLGETSFQAGLSFPNQVKT